MIKQIGIIEKYVDDQTGAQISIMTQKLDGKGNELAEADYQIHYAGLAYIQTPQGPFPLQFEIKDVVDLNEAFGKFRECVEAELARMEQEALEEERKRASALIGIDGNPIEKKSGKEPLIFPPR